MSIERLPVTNDQPNPLYDAFLLAGIDFAAGNSPYAEAYPYALDNVQRLTGVNDDELMRLLEETADVELPARVPLADIVQYVPVEDDMAINLAA